MRPDFSSFFIQERTFSEKEWPCKKRSNHLTYGSVVFIIYKYNIYNIISIYIILSSHNIIYINIFTWHHLTIFPLFPAVVQLKIDWTGSGLPRVIFITPQLLLQEGSGHDLYGQSMTTWWTFLNCHVDCYPVFLWHDFRFFHIIFSFSNNPIGSMYGIYANIYHQYTPNVSIYTIHGSYGNCPNQSDPIFSNPYWSVKPSMVEPPPAPARWSSASAARRVGVGWLPGATPQEWMVITLC